MVVVRFVTHYHIYSTTYIFYVNIKLNRCIVMNPSVKIGPRSTQCSHMKMNSDDGVLSYDLYVVYHIVHQAHVDVFLLGVADFSSVVVAH